MVLRLLRGSFLICLTKASLPSIYHLFILSLYREQDLIRNLSWRDLAVTDPCCRIWCYHTAGDKPHAHKNQAAIVKATPTVSASYWPIIRLPCSFADVCCNPYNCFFFFCEISGSSGILCCFPSLFFFLILYWFPLSFLLILLSCGLPFFGSSLFFFPCRRFSGIYWRVPVSVKVWHQ